MIIRRLAKCEHCKNEAHQKLEHYYPYAWGDDVAGIGYVRVYFTFSCETCGEALLYHAGIPSLHFPEEFDVEECFMNELEEYDEGHQFGFFCLVWPTRVEAGLPSCVPEAVRVMYLEALSVKGTSPNSFAVSIGRALERIRRDLGIPRKELERLKSHSIGLGQIAMKITEWRNIAAHADPRNITTEQVEDIDAFFRLITDYVYVLPHKLERAQSKIEIAVDDTSVDEVVH
jgi:hypothetical protein